MQTILFVVNLTKEPRAVFTILVFIVTYELAQKARVFHTTRLERLASNKHSNLLGLFVSYDDKEVLLIRSQGLHNFATFIGIFSNAIAPKFAHVNEP